MAIKISGTTVINDTTSYVDLGTTGGVRIPNGTTAQRPSGVAGLMRYNTTEGEYEVWDGTLWKKVSKSLYPYPAEYLIVAGGGGGVLVEGGSGGGGAGGAIDSTFAVNSGQAYTVTIGGGSQSGQGGGSSISGVVSVTGGGRGSGGYGGSAGGNGSGFIPAEGNSGGFNFGGGVGPQGGGGGKGSAGQAATGGFGINWKSLGPTYAGGGGGGGRNPGGAGRDGGGNGGPGGNPGQPGGANRGGGCGGPSDRSNMSVGGSGVCIIRYSGAQAGSGGSVSSAGGFTYHTFNSTQTFTG